MRRHKSTPSSHVRVTVTCHVSLVKMGLAIAVHPTTQSCCCDNLRPHKTKKVWGRGYQKGPYFVYIVWCVNMNPLVFFIWLYCWRVLTAHPKRFTFFETALKNSRQIHKLFKTPRNFRVHWCMVVCISVQTWLWRYDKMAYCVKLGRVEGASRSLKWPSFHKNFC